MELERRLPNIHQKIYINKMKIKVNNFQKKSALIFLSCPKQTSALPHLRRGDGSPVIAMKNSNILLVGEP
jgi:hypothetical protein